MDMYNNQNENCDIIMSWNETCSDCYWFDPSSSECTYAEHNSNGDRVRTQPDRDKCRNFS